MSKVEVTLGGVELAANSPVTWRLQTGVQPFRTTFTVHKKVWDSSMSGKLGKPLVLKFNQGHTTQTIHDVYPLYRVPSSSPNRVSFLVADRRWKWSYQAIARDYNIPRKSGDRTILYDEAPVENLVTIDKYDFKPYSLKNGFKWTAQETVEDILGLLTDDGGHRFFIESWPLADVEFSIQNVILRDQGDVALSRLLTFVPGVTIYIDLGGVTRVIDGSDLDAAEAHLQTLPHSTWDGDAEAVVRRKEVRPSVVNVHYTREIECVFEYEDDLANLTQTDPDPNEPYLENVIPTVDPVTTVTHYDPVAKKKVTHDVPQGMWVNFLDLLDAWNKPKERPEGSMPWTWETIRRHWIKGDLEGVLGGAGSRGIPDLDVNGNIMMRVQAIKQHFRQTFKINRRYTERIRDFKVTRVSPMDAVTGARSHAPVWGQYCIIPSTKGERINKRKDKSRAGRWRNFDNLPDEGVNVVDVAPAPARITFIDRDQGVFRVSWVSSPYGTVDTILPCNTVDNGNKKAVPTRDVSRQDTKIMGAGMQLSGGVNSVFLADEMKMKVLLTIIPGAPNNKAQFHIEPIEASDIRPLFQSNLRITGGNGPELDLMVMPGESTARFAWVKDELAKTTIKEMLGIENDDITTAGMPKGTRNLRGFKWMNELREVTPHAKAYAAEQIVAFADSLMGRVTTAVPGQALKIAGNMNGTSITVASAPSAKVTVVHEFPGLQKPISRYAMLSDDARKIVLGIVPFKGEV